MADQVRRVPVQMAHEVPDGSGADSRQPVSKTFQDLPSCWG